MKDWKTWKIFLFAGLCVLLNVGGGRLASGLRLPLWLDSFGTALSAYVGGPVCGSLVGVTGNLIDGLGSGNPLGAVYALTSVALAVVVGAAARRDRLSTFHGVLLVSTLSALASMVISVPLHLYFDGGNIGNLWGDSAAAFLRERGCPHWLSTIAGDFYVNFPDKLLTMLGTALAIKIARRRRPAAAVTAALLLALALGGGIDARAEGMDYADYVRTVFSSQNGLPCGEANDIAQTSDGLMWVGTYAGLYRCNGREFRRMDYDSVRNVNCLYVDGEGRLWVGTNDSGLSIVINEQVVNVLNQSHGLPSDSVRSIVESADGYYYIGTTGSLQILTLNSGLKRVGNLWEVNYAESLAADGEGRVAAVTSDGRLFIMEQGRISASLRLTEGEGVFKCCAFDGAGRLLAGSSASAIYRFDVSSGAFRTLDVLSTPGLSSLNDLSPMADGVMLICADNGVGYVDAGGAFHSLNTNTFNNSIDNALRDYQGNLWFTSSRLGLLRMAQSPFRDVYGTVGMESRVVNAIVPWQGAWYFGTDKGLDAVAMDERRQIHNDLTDQLEGVRIRCLLADSAGSLWICTYGRGLIEVEADGTQHTYADDPGCGQRARVVIELPGGGVAAGGNTGISVIKDHAVVENLGAAQGLDTPIILTLTPLSGDRLLAGTDGGGLAVIENGEVVQKIGPEDGLSSRVILRTIADPVGGGVYVVTSNGLCYMEAAGTVRQLKNFPYFNNYNICLMDGGETLFVISSAGIYVVRQSDLVNDTENMPYDLLDARRGLDGALTANAFPWLDVDGGLYLPCDRGVYILDTGRYEAGAASYRMMVASVRMDEETRRVDHSGTILVDREVNTLVLYPEVVNFGVQDPNVGYRLEGVDREWRRTTQSSLNAVVYPNLQPGDYAFHLAVFDNSGREILKERVYTVSKPRELYDHGWFVGYMALVPLIAVAWLTFFLVRVRMQRALDLRERELTLARQQLELGNQTIIAIAKAVDAKDERTSQHSQRVSEYSVMIARELGFTPAECENLRKAALMHDIGKIGIPDRILNKPARLTDEEYAIMKSHASRGAEILKDFTLIDHVVDGALHHHERYDGRGYPSGLKGEEIPLYGRIIGVADAFDAMTANRVYRKQMDFDYVLGEMHRGRGTQFDPQIVDILLRLIDEGKIDLNTLYAHAGAKEGSE